MIVHNKIDLNRAAAHADGPTSLFLWPICTPADFFFIEPRGRQAGTRWPGRRAHRQSRPAAAADHLMYVVVDEPGQACIAGRAACAWPGTCGAGAGAAAVRAWP